jgi:hypothetical protein
VTCAQLVEKLAVIGAILADENRIDRRLRVHCPRTDGGQFPLSYIPRAQAPPKNANALSWASNTISCVSRG